MLIVMMVYFAMVSLLLDWMLWRLQITNEYKTLLFRNKGEEKCTSGRCTPPVTSEPCNDGDWTTIDICNEITDQCDHSPCDGVKLEVTLTTDNYPSETSWSLWNKCTDLVEQSVSSGFYQNSNTQYSNSYCVPQAEYDFVINDTFGDGKCSRRGCLRWIQFW